PIGGLPMSRWLCIAAALLVMAAPVSAAGLTGQNLESRTCDVYTGPCFANAEMNLSGRNAVLALNVDTGTFDNGLLRGLGVVAVVVASDTLGTQQNGAAKAVLIVDTKADAAQRAALRKLAQQQGGDLVRNVIAVESASISLIRCECKEDACVILQAGSAKVQTRCLDAQHDKACGNDTAFYPQLAQSVKAKVALVSEHSVTGPGL